MVMSPFPPLSILPILMVSAAWTAPTPAVSAEWLDIVVAQTPVRLRVVRTEEDQRRGLMGETGLAKDTGMLFVFRPPRPIAMWMKDTPMDLDLAYLDHQAKVLSLCTMTAGSTELHPSNVPVSYALEMPAGWLRQHGVTSETRIEALAQAQRIPR